VVLGAHKLDQKWWQLDRAYQKVGIKRVVKHSAYDPTNYANDIALVQLEKEVQFTDRIQPVCLRRPAALQPTTDESKFLTAGWGKVGPGDVLFLVLKQLFKHLIPKLTFFPIRLSEVNSILQTKKENISRNCRRRGIRVAPYRAKQAMTSSTCSDSPAMERKIVRWASRPILPT